ncbi:uncharacterized protein CDAR_394601 [Caerostris darwini]|uniref:Uncharacterized protein n=1 Tax=Caerostris darwini TaxID=1538125 RepID=A0AAV4PG30_9ARAC|nr:uncharacterized protein CDAR_394601 [Caerostris darwini]
MNFAGWSDPDGRKLQDFSVYSFYEGRKYHIHYGVKTSVDFILPPGESKIFCSVKDEIGAVTELFVDNVITTSPDNETLEEWKASVNVEFFMVEGKMSVMAQAIASEAIVEEQDRKNNRLSVASEVDKVWKEYWELTGIDSSYYTKEAREEIEAELRDKRMGGTEKEAKKNFEMLQSLEILPFEVIEDSEVYGQAVSALAETRPLNKGSKHLLTEFIEEMADSILETEVPHPEDKTISNRLLANVMNSLSKVHDQTELIRNVTNKMKMSIAKDLMVGEDPLVISSNSGFELKVEKRHADEISGETIENEGTSITLPNSCVLLGKPSNCRQTRAANSEADSPSLGLVVVKWSNILETEGTESVGLSSDSNTLDFSLTNRNGNETLKIKDAAEPFEICLGTSESSEGAGNTRLRHVQPNFGDKDEFLVYHQLTVDKKGMAVKVQFTPDEKSTPFVFFYGVGYKPSLLVYEERLFIGNLKTEGVEPVKMQPQTTETPPERLYTACEVLPDCLCNLEIAHSAKHAHKLPNPLMPIVRFPSEKIEEDDKLKRVRDLMTDFSGSRAEEAKLREKFEDRAEQLMKDLKIESPKYGWIPKEDRPIENSGDRLKYELEQSRYQLAEVRNQMHSLKRELTLYRKLVRQEVGGCYDLHHLMGDKNWKGRAEEIERLKNEIAHMESKAYGHKYLRNPISIPQYNPRFPRIDDLVPKTQVECLRKEAIKKKEDTEGQQLSNFMKEYGNLALMYKASSIHNKILAQELRSLKEQLERHNCKAKEDIDLIKNLTAHQMQMREMLEREAHLATLVDKCQESDNVEFDEKLDAEKYKALWEVSEYQKQSLYEMVRVLAERLDDIMQKAEEAEKHCLENKNRRNELEEQLQVQKEARLATAKSEKKAKPKKPVAGGQNLPITEVLQAVREENDFLKNFLRRSIETKEEDLKLYRFTMKSIRAQYFEALEKIKKLKEEQELETPKK